MLKKNLVANFVGQGWAALMGLAFIPIYIKYLGIEAYGLIGVFAILQSWMALLDLGMTPTLGREMARFMAGTITVQQLRDLLRSIETLTFGLVLSVSIAAFVISPWVANQWLKLKNLSNNVVAEAFAMMGLAIACKFAEGIYRSSLLGLQQQVLFNIINSAIATTRALGAVFVLAFISQSIQIFFLWHSAISLLSIAVLAFSTYKVLPVSSAKSQFSARAIREVWRFAAGMIGVTFLALILTQVDKILLSKLLSLEDFGIYSFAAAVAAGLFPLVSPITQAFYPRFCELVAEGKASELSCVYHSAAQLVSITAGSLAIVLIVNPETVLNLWTQNTYLASRTGRLLSLLALGNLLNCLMWVPYQAQLSHGWTGLAVRVNFVAVSLVIPANLLAVPRFGPTSAAYIWIALNAGYIIFGSQFMYRKIMMKEKWRWYFQDLFQPLSASLVAVLFIKKIFLPLDSSVVHQCLMLVSSLVAAVISSAVVVCYRKYFRVAVR